MEEEYKLSHLVVTDAEAKSCPLCGSPAQTNVWKFRDEFVEKRCFCLNENCSLSKRTYELDEWNTRPIEDALRSRVEELERELDKCRWRKYPEENPENIDVYWCEIASAIDVGSTYLDALNYHPSNGWGTFAKVFRWTFLPEPPEVK